MRFLLAAFVLLFSGCARRYVITLNSGGQITCHGKPQRVGETYIYKDSSGKKFAIPSLRVSEIAPASMVKQNKAAFRPPVGR